MAEKLTPQQQAAVSDRGGKLLVSAAAGSGKTKVLVDRLLRYLTDPVEPACVDDFLIITYTKAAAAELRGKIAQKLAERIAQEPENRHLQQQIQRLYMAKISTVHAFCSDILRENAYRMDLSADFRVADESESALLQMEAVEQVLADAYSRIHEDTDFRALVDTQGFGRDDRQIPQILLQVYHSAVCHLDPAGWLEWCAEQADAEGITDAAQTIWGAYLVSDLHHFLDLQIRALQRCAELTGTNDTMQKVSALLSGTIAQLTELRNCSTWDQIAENKSVDFGRLVFPKNCTDIHLADQVKAIRDACKRGLAAKLRGFTGSSEQMLQDLRACSASTRGLIALVKEFTRQYERLKARKRFLDFADLEHKTLDLLLGKKRSGTTAACQEIAERFREIMVDEYQDSNGVQDAIFSALTQKKQNCFMVGDVKQSIYQFRLADPGIFLDKYNHFVPSSKAQAGQGRKILLSKNFRSGAGVISAVNDVFRQCMSETVGGLDYTEDEMLYEGIPHTGLGEPEVELYGVCVQQDTYAEESAFVADRICTLLDGHHMIRDGDALRPIRPEDIVILLRSPGSVGGEFLYALQARGIRCSTGDSMDLLQTEEVSALISLLQTIDNPQQDIPLLAVLTCRVFGFTADELSLVRSKHRYNSLYDALRSDGSGKVQHFLHVLEGFRKDAQMYRLSELLERILLKTDFYSAYYALEDGDVRCKNLRSFCQAASDFTGNGQRDLGQFLEYLDSISERGLVISADQSGNGAVTIMSIHKSKGLEFPVVFLCGLSRSFNTESTRAQVLCHKNLGLGLNYVDVANRVRYPTVAKRAIAAKIMDESVSEEMRVLYVAMTRARDRLIMTYAKRNLQDDLWDTAMRLQLSPSALLTRQVDCVGDWVIQTALTRTEAGELFALCGNPGISLVSDTPWLIRVVQGVVCTDDMEEQRPEKQPISAQLLEKMKATLSFQYGHEQAVRTPSKQTATQVKGRTKDLEAAEHAQIPRKTTFRKPTFVHKSRQGKDLGNAVHLFMQFADFSACTSEAGVKAEILRLLGRKLLTQEQSDMLDADRIFRFFASDLGRKVRSHNRVIREFKFSLLVDAREYYTDIQDEKILLQGVVDCALIDEDGITVIDFKTDRVSEDSIAAAAERYAPQVQTYRKALSRIYQLPVKDTYLYFFSSSQLIKM